MGIQDAVQQASAQKATQTAQDTLSQQLGLPSRVELKSITDAMLLLQQNGADADGVKSFFMGGGVPTSRSLATAELILANPAIVPFWVRRFPSQGLSSYYQAEMDYGFTSQLASQKTAGPTDIIPGGRQQTAPPDSGPLSAQAAGNEATRYDNGVIVIKNLNDPTADPQVLYPTDAKGHVQGSRRWIENKADAWDQKTINAWRKRLTGMGYSIAPKGPADPDFQKALALAYQSFYANGKKWRAPDASTQVPPLKQAFDPALARTYVRSFFQSAIGDDPTDQELKQGEAWLKDFTRNQLHQGISPSDAFNRAEAHYSDKLYSDPQVSMLMNQQKENTTLRDSLIQAAQASSQIAGGS